MVIKKVIPWYDQYHSWPHFRPLHIQIFIVCVVILALGVFDIRNSELEKKNQERVLGSTDVSVTINAGSLTLSSQASASLSSVTLAASTQTATGDLGNVTVEDNRGSGAGWNATATLTDFTCCTPTRTVAVTNATITPGSLTTNAGTADATAGSAHTYTSTTDQATLMTAGSDQGMGSYTVAPSLSLDVPVGSYAGSYTATVTTTVS